MEVFNPLTAKTKSTYKEIFGLQPSFMLVDVAIPIVSIADQEATEKVCRADNDNDSGPGNTGNHWAAMCWFNLK